MAVSEASDALGANQRTKLAQIRQIEKTAGVAAAERALVDMLREGPQTHRAFLGLCQVLIKQTKFADALRAAEKAKSLAPLEAGPLVAVGFVKMRQHELPDAAEAFAQAIRLDPDSTRAHLGAAAVKMADENYEDALELCGKVLALNPTMDRAHELVARIQMKRGQTNEALAELKTIVQKSPKNQRALRAYLQLMRREERSDEALKFIEAEAEANPDDKLRARRLAHVGAMLGDASYATKQYDESAKRGKVGVAGRVRFIIELINAGETERAQTEMAALDDNMVLRPILAKLNGDIALKSEDADEAIKHYQTACRAARVEMLDAAAEAEGSTALEKARLWRAHTRRAITMAAHSRRAA